MLRITKAQRPAGETIFRLTGVLRQTSLHSLADELEHALGRGEVILDLGELTYIDSAGAALLRRASDQASLVNVPPFVEALLTRSVATKRNR